MRILLLSAYDAASHRQWRLGLVEQLAEHSWQQLTLPPRHFAWRIRGNALSWAGEQRQIIAQPYDLIIATSMVDLATLRGIAPELANTPALLYFHENQFAYPATSQQQGAVEAQITSIYSALAADAIVFNSHCNRNSFLEGASALLTKMPDHAPGELIRQIKARSTVLPVPLDRSCFAPHEKESNRPLTLLWNHRWEYDKAPERLYLLLKALKARNASFRLHLIGQQFRRIPEAIELIRNEFSAELETFGYVEDRVSYLALLRQSDLAISTALHDFQGIALLEAVAAGCTPVAPDRLAYPELLPAVCLCESFPDDAEKEAQAMAERVIELRHGGPAIDLSYLAWDQQIDHYRAIITACAHRGRRTTIQDQR